MNVAPVRIDTVWAELVTACLLGTDRRSPPDLPPGPLADLVADAMRLDPAARMLDAVATVAAARRAAVAPLPPAGRLQPPDPDPRPVVSAAAAASWRTIVSEWPVLEDEWVLTVIGGGWRLPADVLVAALLRHRSDAVRRARVALAGGPLAGWVGDHVDALAPRGSTRTVAAEAVHSLPELPVPPELAPLLTAGADTFASGFAQAVEGSGPAHRPVLANMLARCRPEVLVDAAALLAERSSGSALALADLARLRHRALDELSRAGRRAV